MKFFGGDSILKTIKEEVENYNNREGRIATYIIIHEADIPKLLQEMIQAKMLPDGETNIFQINGLRVIKTTDIRQNSLVVVGD